MSKAIALDDGRTWPRELRAFLKANEATFRDFRREDDRIYKRGCEDIHYRLTHPANPHANARREAAEACREIISDLSVIGYHCTRLCPDEVKSIESGGMRTCGSDLVRHRLAERVAAGDLIQADADSLLAGHAGDVDGRRGQIWFVTDVSTLSDEGGVHLLLDLWGGEAIYWRHMSESDPLRSVLRRIGTPCIVEASLPLKAMKVFSNFEEAFIWRYFKFDDRPCGEGYVANVASEQIRRVIPFDDPAFQKMTRWDTWRESPR